jgi:hypothetical protein
VVEVHPDDLICHACYVKGKFILGMDAYTWFTFEEAHQGGWMEDNDSPRQCVICKQTHGQCIQVWCLSVPEVVQSKKRSRK